MGLEGLDFRTVPVAFTQGLDTKTQRKLVVPGKWDTLINLTLAEDGTPKRRDGFEMLIDEQAGNGLATHAEQLLVIDGPSISTVATGGAGVTAIAASGKIGNVEVSKAVELSRPSGIQARIDCAYGNGLICTVWEQKSFTGGTGTAAEGVFCTIIDAETGAHVLDAAIIDATTGGGAALSPRVAFADNAFFIFYIVGTGAGTSLTCRVIDATNPTTAQTVGAPVALVTSADLVRRNIDAVTFPSDAEVTVLYAWADGTDSAQAISVGQALTVPKIGLGPVQVFSEGKVPFASIEAFALCVFSSGTDIGAFVISSSAGLAGSVLDQGLNVTTSAGGVILSITVGATLGDCHLCAVQDGTRLRVFRDFASEQGTNAVNQIIAQVVTTALATFFGPTDVIPQFTYGGAGNPLGPEGPYIYGKPFTSNGRIYLPVHMNEANVAGTVGSNLQNCIFLLDTGPSSSQIAPGVVVAKALYQTLGAPTLTSNMPVGTPCSFPSVAELGAFALPAAERSTLNIFNGANVSPTGLVLLTMAPNFSHPPTAVTLGENTFFEGGSLAMFDGVSATEAGFPLFPEGIIVAATAGGVGTDGVHVVAATYDWTDAAGNVHRSALSPTQSVTLGAGNNTARVRVPTLALSQRTSLTISVWMTAAGGTTLFLASQLNANSTAAAFVTINVNLADADLIGNRLAYNQPLQAGTTLPNVAPNPMHGIGVSQRRLWGFLSDEPLEYAYSQEVLPNTGLQFNNDNLGGALPSGTGKGVATAELDEKTILFAERGIYVVFGSGPTPSGGFNNFSDPKPVPSDVGCSDARSVCAIPQGLMFKSAKGWYLLGRDLSVRYIGDGVARFDGQNVTSAVMVGDRQEVRITSTDGATLVYDYLNEQWSVFYMGNILHPGNVIGAVWWPATERYVHLQPSTGLFFGLLQDTPGAYVDGDGAANPLQAFIYGRTAFLHLSPLEGFQRVRRMFLTATAETALPENDLVIAVDVNDAYFGALSYSFTVDLGLITSFDEQAVDLRHKLSSGRQKVKSVAFSFLEGGGANFDAVPLTGLQALALEVGFKRGAFKLRAAQTVG